MGRKISWTFRQPGTFSEPLRFQSGWKFLRLIFHGVGDGANLTPHVGVLSQGVFFFALERKQEVINKTWPSPRTGRCAARCDWRVRWRRRRRTPPAAALRSERWQSSNPVALGHHVEQKLSFLHLLEIEYVECECDFRSQFQCCYLIDQLWHLKLSKYTIYDKLYIDNFCGSSLENCWKNEGITQRVFPLSRSNLNTSKKLVAHSNRTMRGQMK